jgi:3-oxoacyl-[acyl-carrier protein] reductase
MSKNQDARRVALITGGGTGVGRACALQFADRGFNVVINYSRSAQDAEQTAADVAAKGVDSLALQCDVSDDRAVREMMSTVEQRFGRLDVLVNNAAMTHFVPHNDLEGMKEEMWDRILDVNLKGPFFCTRAAAKLLTAGEGGAVVNVSSVAAELGLGSSIAYCASKAGLNTMTKSLARVLAPKVRVNAVCPGPIDSRWIREGNPNWDIHQMVANFPLPKPSQPSDIADAVLFLAVGTKMATGQLLTIDGGQTL